MEGAMRAQMRMQLASRASKPSSQSIALLHKQLKAKKGQGTRMHSVHCKVAEDGAKGRGQGKARARRSVCRSHVVWPWSFSVVAHGGGGGRCSVGAHQGMC